MPEDRLEKMLAHRKAQEKKNDQLRVHKNKLENDRLRSKSAYLDWNKQLRHREFLSLEGEYMRRLERIYDRQMQIEERRRKEEQEKEQRESARLERRASLEVNQEAVERDRKKQMHGMKQDRAKSFMSKAKTLSTGYRDNDPPQAYYKRKGIVPPDRLVTPELSATAQATLGGGAHLPASSQHLNRTPKETAFGITIPDQRRRKLDSARSRNGSVATERTSMTSIDDVTANDDKLIDEVIRVQVRPSTAPSKHLNKLPEDGVITAIDVTNLGSDDDVSDIDDVTDGASDVERRRPATAAATVHFDQTSYNDNGEGEKGKVPRSPSNPNVGRRRGSLMPQLMFRRRSQPTVGGASPGATASGAGSRRASSAGAKSKRGGGGGDQLMSNAEQERIRRKMREKARCLETERMRRAVIAATGFPPKARRSANSTPRLLEIPDFSSWSPKGSGGSTLEFSGGAKRRRRSGGECRDAMMRYVRRCGRGEIMGDPREAQDILLTNTRTHLARLHADVDQFVRR